MNLKIVAFRNQSLSKSLTRKETARSAMKVEKGSPVLAMYNQRRAESIMGYPTLLADRLLGPTLNGQILCLEIGKSGTTVRQNYRYH